MQTDAASDRRMLLLYLIETFEDMSCFSGLRFLMLCKFDLEKSNDLSIPVLKQAIYVVKFQYLYSIEGFCRNVYSF